MTDLWQAKLQWTLSELKKLREKHPDDRLIVSGITQLQYLLALAEGTESDDSSLEKIDIGYLAVYSLADVVSYDLSVAMCDISEGVRHILRRQGRKPNIDRTGELGRSG
ncbi:MAG: hypothetical protein KAV82_03465 [Phycisphaerae bacterium]|nr:hypothetical protein [Phycisphaerae bacterium]